MKNSSYSSYSAFYADAEGKTIRPGETATFTFSAEPSAMRKYRLFFAGESAIFKFWKNEPDFQWQYHTVTDALDTAHALKSQYCLDFSSAKPEDYIRRVYRKVAWPPSLSYLWSPPTDRLTFGIRVRTSHLNIAADGYLRIRLEARAGGDGFAPADRVFTLDITPGEEDSWTEFAQDCELPAEKVTHLSVLVEGARYSGEVFFERPFLKTAYGWNLLPDFSVPVPDKQKFDWTAQYLSRKEWPEFRVELNGQKVFEGEIFERCHLSSEWELPFDRNALRADNTLSVTLLSSYHDPLPYTFHEAGLIAEESGRAILVAIEKAAPANGFVRLLFETEEDNVEVEITSSDCRLTGGHFVFARAGLHGVRLPCGAPGAHIPITVRGDGICIDAEIERIAVRADDGVATGTGDMVYVHQDIDSFREYLKWYLAEGVGNLVTARPTYRWSGSRTLDRASWEEFTRVLNELGIEYVHMWDGRELPGQNANPDAALLAGRCFRGSQTHERDGACFYWGVRGSGGSKFLQQLWEMQHRVYDEDPLHVNPQYCRENYFNANGDMYWFRPPVVPADTRLAHDILVAHLAASRRNAALRHTGPTVMFKYFLEAGYSWFGMETMYTTMEPYMAFLRGAARFAKIDRPGVHHAMQWSTSPYDVSEHVRRYRLALYSSYIQGASEINTEEGLWHIEEYYTGFNRFSQTCRDHLRQQQDLYRFTQTHTRSGRFATPMALLHGRLDGWHGFGLWSPWGIKEIQPTDAEKSWDLLKVFYPLAAIGRPVYCHYCPDDYEVGFFTGTPSGNIDVIPVESDAALFGDYRAFAFLGYNCAEAGDFDRLLARVEKDGKLLLTRAHLSDTTAYADIADGNLHPLPHHAGFTCGEPRFVQSAVNGHPLRVCENILPPREIAACTDDGQPLVCRYACGNGEITLFNTDAYPSNPAIRALYEQELKTLFAAETAAEKVWCECGDDVEFAVYKQDDGSSHIYLMAVDWYRDPLPERRAVIRTPNFKYEVRFPFGILVKAVVCDDTAVWTHSESADILTLADGSATLQGCGEETFTVAADGHTRDIRVDLSKTGYTRLHLADLMRKS